MYPNARKYPPSQSQSKKAKELFEESGISYKARRGDLERNNRVEKQKFAQRD
jgi:hypothetical protein